MDCKIMEQSEIEPYSLYDKWTLWAHLPHDTDWSIGSYKRIMNINSVTELITLYDCLNDKLIQNCMLFLMRKGIKPTWEDTRNKDGGCFSFKIPNKNVPALWKNLSYGLLGESLSSNPKFVETINGITVSPKKMFCIIKVWVSSCDFTDCSLFVDIDNLDKEGCLFKRHKPEY